MDTWLQKQMHRRLRSFAVRLVFAATVLLTLGRIYEAALVRPMLPAFAWTIETVDDRLRVEHIGIANRKADTFIELKATPVRMMMLGQRTLMPDPKLFFEPAILLGNVLQPVIIFLSIVLAWPGARLWNLAARLLLAVPMTALLLIVNVPLGFVGVMQDFREYFPDVPVTLMVYWNDFLQTGGALALAIAGGVLVVSVSYKCRSNSSGRGSAIERN